MIFSILSIALTHRHFILSVVMFEQSFNLSFCFRINYTTATDNMFWILVAHYQYIWPHRPYLFMDNNYALYNSKVISRYGRYDIYISLIYPLSQIILTHTPFLHYSCSTINTYTLKLSKYTLVINVNTKNSTYFSRSLKNYTTIKGKKKKPLFPFIKNSHIFYYQLIHQNYSNFVL